MFRDCKTLMTLVMLSCFLTLLFKIVTIESLDPARLTPMRVIDFNALS